MSRRAGPVKAPMGVIGAFTGPARHYTWRVSRMTTVQPVPIGPVSIGPGRPLLWVLGPCVIESHDLTLRIADTLAALGERLRLPLVFKASFDKANRTSGK